MCKWRRARRLVPSLLARWRPWPQRRRNSQRNSPCSSKRGRYLVALNGKKFAEGEEFGGFTIRSIDIDRVIFERAGHQFEFYVASLGARQ